MATGAMKIDALEIISKYYERGSASYIILVAHSMAVAQKSLEIAGRLGYGRPDMEFIEEAAMLHDIGIFMVDEPDLGCNGNKPYICHGYLGRELLEKEGLPRHALVCERHVGVGISVDDIDANDLPIPRRDMLPVSLEEKIICYADKYFSKKKGALNYCKPIEEVRRQLIRYGREQLKRFERMHKMFGV